MHNDINIIYIGMRFIFKSVTESKFLIEGDSKQVQLSVLQKYFSRLHLESVSLANGSSCLRLLQLACKIIMPPPLV